MDASQSDLLTVINQRITELEYNQQQVGDFLGLDQGGISRRLSGKTPFKLKELTKLLPFLGIANHVIAHAEYVPFLRLALLATTIPLSTQKQVAILLRAVADEFDRVS